MYFQYFVKHNKYYLKFNINGRGYMSETVAEKIDVNVGELRFGDYKLQITGSGFVVLAPIYGIEELPIMVYKKFRLTTKLENEFDKLLTHIESHPHSDLPNEFSLLI